MKHMVNHRISADWNTVCVCVCMREKKKKAVLSCLYEFDWPFEYLSVSCLIILVSHLKENGQWPPVISGSV